MKCFARHKSVLTCLSWLLPLLYGCATPSSPQAPSQSGVSVLTQHNDNARTGANLHESVLNVANVNTAHFGKLFELSVDGDIYGQPLYAPNVDVPGKGRRNLIYVATMHDSVYAFDADQRGNGEPIWVQHLGIPVPSSIYCDGARLNFHKEIGIVSTPVISMSRNALYVVAFVVENGDTYHYLHALDIGTGEEKFKGPKRIQADGFISRFQNQRPALLLANDAIYVGFASYGDCGPFRGWLLGYGADTLENLPRAFTTNTLPVPGNGIWQAGQGPAADADGNVYLATGNGTSRDILPPLHEPAGKASFSEQAVGSPAAIDIGTRLLIAWTSKSADSSSHIKIATWRDQANLADVQTLGDTSLDGPALTSGNGRNFLSWTENDSQNMKRVWIRSSGDPRQWTGEKIVIPNSLSLSGPALAFGKGRLFAAWTDKNKNVIVRSSVDGTHWLETDKATLRGPAAGAPQLAFIDDKLFLLWAGADRAMHLMGSDEGTTFSPISKKWDSAAHAALVKEGPFWLAWTRGNSEGSLGIATGRTPGDLAGNETTYQGDYGQNAPAMAALNGALYLLWTGGSNSSLNIARISEVPALANSFVKLRPDLKLADWFTAWNTGLLNTSDVDLGSAGPLLLPGTDLVVGGGKEGKLYLLERNNLGGFCTKCGEPNGDTQIPQWFQATPKPCEIAPDDCGALPPAATFYHIHGSPVYWDGPDGPFIYIWGEASNPRGFKLENGRFATIPVTNGLTTPARSMPGAMLSLSANSNDRMTGIIWASHPTGCTGKRDNTEKDARCTDPMYWGDASSGTVRGTLRAFDASTMKEIWNSDQRTVDALGFVSKFAPPTIVNGKVYAATFADPAVEHCLMDACRAKLVVYGLH